MSLMTTIPDKFCEWFSDMNEFSDCSFCTQFPVNSKATPLIKPVIVFGTDSIKVLDNTTDETGTVITDSRTAQIKFSMGIHVPRSHGGTGCNTLFDRLTDLIIFNTTLAIIGIQTESIEYIRNTDSLYLKAVFTTEETLVRGENYPSALTF